MSTTTSSKPIHPLYSQKPLSAGLQSIYTLKRPLSALGDRTTSNRFLEASNAGRPDRPMSALQRSFVTWSGGDMVTRPSSAMATAKGSLGASSPPARLFPLFATDGSLVGGDVRSQLLFGGDGNDLSDPIEKVPLTPPQDDLQISEQPSTPEHHTFTTPAKPLIRPTELQSSVNAYDAPTTDVSQTAQIETIISPSRLVNNIRTLANQSRSDSAMECVATSTADVPTVAGDVPLVPATVPAQEAEALICAVDGIKSTVPPEGSHIAVEDTPAPNIFALDIRSKFVDFVERDKYFEGIFAILRKQEFNERLQTILDEIAVRNGLYVSMTKPYIRWAETGLNPNEPDPIKPIDPEVIALRQVQYRRNLDNLFLQEEKARRNLDSVLFKALVADGDMLYLFMEEEAVRRHIVDTFEPERWSSVTHYIHTFLSTRLVNAFDLFKAWSLMVGDIEREEGWHRSLLLTSFESRMKTLRVDKLQESEVKRRELISMEEGIRFSAVTYAITNKLEALKDRDEQQQQQQATIVASHQPNEQSVEAADNAAVAATQPAATNSEPTPAAINDENDQRTVPESEPTVVGDQHTVSVVQEDLAPSTQSDTTDQPAESSTPEGVQADSEVDVVGKNQSDNIAVQAPLDDTEPESNHQPHDTETESNHAQLVVEGENPYTGSTLPAVEPEQ